jgi:sugar/nucleoside kinase (ribokinase family)
MVTDPALVVGLIGLDRLLLPSSAIVRGRKLEVRVEEAPGYFGLNVASQLRTLGIPATLVTVTGEDSLGERLVAEARAVGLEVVRECIPGRVTSCSHILVEGGERTVLRSTGNASEVWSCDRFLSSLLTSRAWSWLCLGHLRGDADGATTRRIIRSAAGLGVPISWTPGETRLCLGTDAFAAELRAVRLLVLNREEANEFAELPPATPAADALTMLAGTCGSGGVVVVTQGGDGPALCFDSSTGRDYTVVPLSVQVVDPTGAGDAFHAGMAAALAQGRDVETALEVARRQAAAVCGCFGGAGLLRLGTVTHCAGRSPGEAPALGQADHYCEPWAA